MTTRLIRLQDGTLIEVETQLGEPSQISSGAAKRVLETLDVIQPILVNACRPVIAAWKDLNKETTVEKAELELGLSFEGEGNIYITKVKGGANLTVKLTLRYDIAKTSE